MIELDKAETWPNQIVEILKNRSGSIKKEKDFQDNAYKNDPLLRYSLSGPRTDSYYDTEYKIKEIILNQRIKGYHCSRVTDWDDIRKNGLSPLNYKHMVRSVIFELSKLELSPELISTVKTEYEKYRNTENFKNRENTLWFVMTKELTDDWGCVDFFKYFGREISRRALYYIKETLFPLLAMVGIPTVIECRLKISELGYKIDWIANQMIMYGINHFVMNEPFSPNCEACINTKVEGYDIVDIWEKHVVE